MVYSCVGTVLSTLSLAKQCGSADSAPFKDGTVLHVGVVAPTASGAKFALP